MNGIFGKKIKTMRKEKGFTIDEISKKLKISKGYISDIENGKRLAPSDNVVRKLAKILDVEKKMLLRLAHIDKISEDIKYELHISKIVTPPKYLSKKGKELSSILEEGFEQNKKATLLEDRIPIARNFDDIDGDSNSRLENIKDYILFKIGKLTVSFALQLPDDSMERKLYPCFRKNSIVFFSKAEKIQQNDFVLVIYSSEFNSEKNEKIFRQVSQSNRGKITLKALNTKIRREIIVSRKNIICVWKAVGYLELI